MNIQSSTLLSGTSKTIKVVNGCIIATEGPNMVSKMGLGGLNIDYDSVMTTRQTLKVSGLDTPIMYGFLGSEITLLCIIPTYGTANPYSCSGTSNYLEYYYEDEPLVRRTLTDILILSGDAEHRIPQVYLYNPNSYIVTIDIMVANLDENTISTSLVPTYTEFKGLSFSSVQTDQIYSTTCTGSTQFEIKDINGNVQVVIPYNKIDIITINNELITVSTKSDNSIKLTFLSAFNAKQALSRMSWVMESSINRYITGSYPGLDTTAPVITFNPYSIPEVLNSYYTLGGGVINQTTIRNVFISSVVDYDNANIVRDASINKEDVNLLIINNLSGDQTTGITVDGSYSITFTATDVAGNSVSSTKQAVVDFTPPTIHYFSTAMASNTIDLTGGTISQSTLRSYYINYVSDTIDITIPNTNVTIYVTSGATPISYPISGIGYYDLTFSVFDSAGNEGGGTTTLHVIESSFPVITYNNVFIGTGFTMTTSNYPLSIYYPTGISYTDIISYAISAVTDTYDGNIPLSNVIVSGAGVEPITTGLYDITISVSDSSGNNTSVVRELRVI